MTQLCIEGESYALEQLVSFEIRYQIYHPAVQLKANPTHWKRPAGILSPHNEGDVMREDPVHWKRIVGIPDSAFASPALFVWLHWPVAAAAAPSEEEQKGWRRAADPERWECPQRRMHWPGDPPGPS